MPVALLAGLLLAAVPPNDVTAADAPPDGAVADTVARDLAQLQGKWENRMQRDGAQLRVVKEINGNRESLQVYRNGRLVHQHAVEIALEQEGDVRVFRWTKGEITFGPKKGAPMPDGAFVYRLQEENWTAVFGLLEGENRPVAIEVFKRLK